MTRTIRIVLDNWDILKYENILTYAVTDDDIRITLENDKFIRIYTKNVVYYEVEREMMK